MTQRDGPSCPGCGLPNYEGLCPHCRGDQDAYERELVPPFATTMTPEAEAAHRPCARFWGSDGTLCATHNGRFLSPSETRCTKAEAAHREPERWHGDGALCIGPGCQWVDGDGDHPTGDVHSNDWYDGYAAGQKDAALAAEPIAASSRLDEAWAEAEAAAQAKAAEAIPEVYELRVGRFSQASDYWADAWCPDVSPDGPTGGISERGPTPAAALLALAERLRATPEPEGQS